MAVIETKKVIGLEGLPQILPKQWEKIGEGLIDRIRKDASRGLSQEIGSARFEEYSESYRKRKKRGTAFKGRSTSSQISPPNLKYTGEMLKRITIESPTKNGVIIRFEQGLKVQYNRDKDGRDIFDVNLHNWKFITDSVMEVFNANAKKLKNIKIPIGK